MDVILDTNILVQDRHLSGRKSAALFSYLEKRQSSLILPEIVVQEALAHFRRELVLHTSEHDAAAASLRKLSFLGQDVPLLSFDTESEIRRYREVLLEPRKHRKTKIAVNDAADLCELVTRLTERRKPASATGQQARDVLLWLAIKRHLAATKTPAVFISTNTGDFCDTKDADALATSLRNELQGCGAEIRFFTSLDAFLKTEAARIDFLTKEWIERALPERIVRERAERLLERDTSARIRRYLERKFGRAGYEGPEQHRLETLWLDDFYAYDEDGSLYLSLTYVGDIEFRVYGRDEDVWAERPAATRPQTVTATLELYLSASVGKEGIVDVEVDEWAVS